MKKRICTMLLALAAALALVLPAAAADFGRVYDEAGLLTEEERSSLESMAETISSAYGVGVYAAAVNDFRDYGDGTVYEVTYQLYHQYELGEGADRDGIIVLLSMDDRDYAMFVYGPKAESVFNSYWQEQLEKEFLSDFGRDDWYGGFYNYISACDRYLERDANGGSGDGDDWDDSPVGPSGGIGFFFLVHRTQIIIWVIASCVIALLVCLLMRRKMKSVRRKVEANAYVTPDGLTLTDQYDRYTHTTETRRKIEKESSSGSSSESGGGGSGRSGKF